ncbi:MAG TPA: 2-C-methyl-D-erythritol 2,4-cyclodiphosphate synthase [Fimbriimonadaceae bacterium]|nr:2-C-methyl-D-erythritol 2,4-cyclodiphosphate synthase [Fimbriimonadaceae bacterium]
MAAILAAGRGERFGADKTQVLLGDRPVWRWSYDAYRSHPSVDSVALIGSPENLEGLKKAAPDALFHCAGGRDRRESSRIAVEMTPPEFDVVLLHDAARPFVSPKMITDVIEAIARSGAAAPGIPITDTVKRKLPKGLETVDRSALFTVQTPQGARRELLLQAHREAAHEVTDDLGLLEAIGIVPEIVPGEPENIKITTPEDVARWKANQRLGEVRTGMGYDVHPFSGDPLRPMFLGGIEFPGVIGLEGHSDADVLLHAAVDALLGAAGMGDIGQHFPNDDPRWRNAPSTHFLRHAATLLKDAGWRIQNLDMTVIAEHPKVMSHAETIRRHVAHTLEVEPSRVNLKATTNERLGFIGRGEGIAALATATIAKP